jgi:hypothetical protein
MSWFERSLQGREPEDLDKEVGRFVRASGLDQALTQMCGPFGCRRFVIRYEVQGGKVVLTELETHALPFGGGPPDPRGAEEAFQPLAAAANRLHKNMATSLPWTRGAVSVVRDAADNMEFIPLFDEDADEAVLADLVVPGPPGHPLEGLSYQDMVAANEAGMETVHGETSRRRGSWSDWEVSEDDKTLTLTHPSGASRHRCKVLGTFHPSTARFSWVSDEPIFEEAIFQTPTFSATLDAVMELGMITVVRLDGSWLFLEGLTEGGDIVLVAVWG